MDGTLLAGNHVAGAVGEESVDAGTAVAGGLLAVLTLGVGVTRGALAGLLGSRSRPSPS